MDTPMPSADHDSMPEQRHADLQRLDDTIRETKKGIMTWLIPMVGVAVITLIANHFEQKRMSEQIATLNTQIMAMNRRFEIMNEKVIAMWVGGDWHKRYSSPSSPENSETH